MSGRVSTTEAPAPASMVAQPGLPRALRNWQQSIRSGALRRRGPGCVLVSDDFVIRIGSGDYVMVKASNSRLSSKCLWGRIPKKWSHHEEEADDVRIRSSLGRSAGWSGCCRGTCCTGRGGPIHICRRIDLGQLSIRCRQEAVGVEGNGLQRPGLHPLSRCRGYCRGSLGVIHQIPQLRKGSSEAKLVTNWNIFVHQHPDVPQRLELAPKTTARAPRALVRWALGTAQQSASGRSATPMLRLLRH